MSEKTNRLRRSRGIANSLLLCAILTGLGGCSTDAGGPVSTSPTPVATLVGYDGCQQSLSPGPAIDCLEYNYTHGGTLRLRHIGAAFNCCPGEIYADITITDGEIVIDEKEKEHACRCLCLYDVDYTVKHLKAGKYEIRVIEHALLEHDEELICQVDLQVSPSGICCVERTHYPWQ